MEGSISNPPPPPIPAPEPVPLIPVSLGSMFISSKPMRAFLNFLTAPVVLSALSPISPMSSLIGPILPMLE